MTKMLMAVGGAVAAVVLLITVTVLLTSDDGVPGGDRAAVACWDGRTDSRDACGWPMGRKGLATVFPSAGAERCREGDPVGERVEAVVCTFERYTVTYSRWPLDADQVRRISEERDSGGRQQGEPWMHDGDPVGWVWSGRDPVAEQSWEVAAYDNAPYDVVVQAADDESRLVGVKSVGARAPEEIGLAFEEAGSTVVPLPVPPADPEPLCWNGAPVPEGEACPLPIGREGLATVFPSMDEACEERPSQLKNKLEVFECTYASYTLKYSRWKEDYDRFDYFDRKNAEHLDAAQDDWRLGGKVVGKVWTSIDTRPDQDRPFRWQASYDDWPYEVLVQGVDEAGREEGMAAVRARLPREIGLR